jgi:prevent-host-death family protein
MPDRTVGAYEAKTHLPRLLDEVAAGETITITKHGVPVALLVPATQARADLSSTIAQLRAFRDRHPLNGLKIKDLIEEGRHR